MVSKERLNPRSKAILEWLYSKGVPCTIQEISDGVNVSWGAAKAHLDMLESYKFVVKVKRPKKIMYEFNYELHGDE